MSAVAPVRVLVVDDDPEILALLRVDLELLRFHVDCARDGIEGLNFAEANPYDLVVLDVMMPKLDGYGLAQKIRLLPWGKAVPLIMLTAKGTLGDKVRGFNAGVDDYLVKPFEFQELMVRMRALFRRTGALDVKPTEPVKAEKPLTKPSDKAPEVLSHGDITLLPNTLEVRVCDKTLKLTPTEFEILVCLMQHLGQAVSLPTLLKEVWGYEPDEDVRMLRVHVGGLRQKLELDPKHPRYIETITHVGYRLNTQPDLPLTTGTGSLQQPTHEPVV